MTNTSSYRFLEASFSLPELGHRALIAPTAPNVAAPGCQTWEATPNGLTWKEVTASVLAEVPSRLLFNLVASQLERDLKSFAIKRNNRWIIDKTKEAEVKALLQAAQERFLAIRNGVFAKELHRAIYRLFARDPRYMARLSGKAKPAAAVYDVTRRVVAQLHFSWELTPIESVDGEKFGLRLVQEMREIIFERLARYPIDREMMPAQRFIRYDFYLKKMGQYLGVNRDYDQIFCLLADACRLFPRDGSSMYGLRLDDFWRRMALIGEKISQRLEQEVGVIKNSAE